MLTNNNLHIVRIDKTDVKQVIRKKINKKRYLYPLTVSLPESMVFTLFGLHERRALNNGCRGKLCFLYPSNKTLLQFSWTHFPVNHNKWPSKPRHWQDTIQYETKRHFSTSPHSVCTVLFTVFFMIKIICILFSSIGALFLKIIDVKLLQKDKYCTTCLHIPLAHPCLYDYLLSPQFTVLHCTFYSLFVFYIYIFYLYLCIFSCVVLHILHCPLSGPVLIYISLLIIFCIIEYVTNKRTLNLKMIYVKLLQKDK